VAELFAAHSWPGNVRELRNVMERAVILAGSGAILPAHLPRAFASRAESAIPEALREPAASGAFTLEPGMTVDDAERALIEITLRHTAGNRTRAAEILDISPKTLLNKLKAYSSA
jgi:DNA-binding NtrC family response regulator